MAKRLQLRRGSGSPGELFFEGEPLFDKDGKILYIGDKEDPAGIGTTSGSAIASAETYESSSQMLNRASSGSAGEVKFYQDTDQGTHYVGLAASVGLASTLTFVLPSNYGADGQALKSDGNGGLSFGDVSVGFSSLQDDTNPVLGSNLDLNSNNIVGTGITIDGSSGIITATKFVKTGGTSSQYLMADGSTALSTGAQGVQGVQGVYSPIFCLLPGPKHCKGECLRM